MYGSRGATRRAVPLLAATALLSAGPARAGAWVLGPGEGRPELATLRRKAVYVSPGPVLDAGGGRSVSRSVPFSAAGRNWPAGPIVSVGIAQGF